MNEITIKYQTEHQLKHLLSVIYEMRYNCVLEIHNTLFKRGIFLDASNDLFYNYFDKYSDENIYMDVIRPIELIYERDVLELLQGRRGQNSIGFELFYQLHKFLERNYIGG